MTPSFRRRPVVPAPHDPRPAIARFWAWWESEGCETCTTYLSVDDVKSAVRILAGRVNVLSPELSVTVGPGVPRSAFLLTVTASGDARVRSTARRWLVGAPPPTPTWSFTDVAGPVEDLDITLLDPRWTVNVSTVEASWRRWDDGDRVDVHIVHPAFDGRLDADGEAELGLTVLEDVVGERAMELWLGRITFGTEPDPECRTVGCWAMCAPSCDRSRPR